MYFHVLKEHVLESQNFSVSLGSCVTLELKHSQNFDSQLPCDLSALK